MYVGADGKKSFSMIISHAGFLTSFNCSAHSYRIKKRNTKKIWHLQQTLPRFVVNHFLVSIEACEDRHNKMTPFSRAKSMTSMFLVWVECSSNIRRTLFSLLGFEKLINVLNYFVNISIIFQSVSCTSAQYPARKSTLNSSCNLLRKYISSGAL